MKKLLAFILSLVLVFTLVVAVACNKEPGGNNFKEVDLTNTDARTEFVNALAEKVDTAKLIGDPTQKGWTFGLEENTKSKLNLDLALTPEQADATEATDSKLTAKANVELNESLNVSLKSNGKSGPEFVAAALSLSAKGNVSLSDEFYELFGSFVEGIDDEEDSFDLAAVIKKLLTNFNYSVDAYVDPDVALINLSDGLYNNLPEMVQEMLGSKKIKIPFGASASTLAVAEGTDSSSKLEKEQIKLIINNLIDSYLLPFKISVSVANQNGYALKLTVTKESVLAILNAMAPSEMDEDEESSSASWLALIKETVENSLSNDTKFELTVRVDKKGAFSSVSLVSNFKLNIDLDIPDVGNLKGSVALSGSVEVKKFNGKINKPSEKGYTEFSGFNSGDSDTDFTD